jgi:hypothetical protein
LIVALLVLGGLGVTALLNPATGSNREAPGVTAEAKTTYDSGETLTPPPTDSKPSLSSDEAVKLAIAKNPGSYDSVSETYGYFSDSQLVTVTADDQAGKPEVSQEPTWLVTFHGECTPFGEQAALNQESGSTSTPQDCSQSNYYVAIDANSGKFIEGFN